MQKVGCGAFRFSGDLLIDNQILKCLLGKSHSSRDFLIS